MDPQKLEAMLAEIKDILKDICVVMMTAFGDIKTSVVAMKLGAYDYVNKPINLEQLMLVIQKGLKSKELSRELLRLRRRQNIDVDSNIIPSQSPSMQAVYKMVQQVARSESTTVLIEGESGTGRRALQPHPQDAGTGQHADDGDQLRVASRGAPRIRALRAREGIVHRRPPR